MRFTREQVRQKVVEAVEQKRLEMVAHLDRKDKCYCDLLDATERRFKSDILLYVAVALIVGLVMGVSGTMAVYSRIGQEGAVEVSK